MNKAYNVFLGETNIGTTLLEKADVPTGVVFGNMSFIEVPSPYNFFKDYCIQQSLGFTEYPKMDFISTFNIPALRVVNNEGIEIKGISTEISGDTNKGFAIYLLGIADSIYSEEFPHHIEIFNNQFKKLN
jgi:hypothetical protein